MKQIVKVALIGQVQSGTSMNGEWQKLVFVGDTLEQYSRKIAFTVMKPELINAFQNVRVGDDLEVSFSIESREYNGRWYTDVRCFNVTAINGGVAQTSQPQQPTVQAQPTQPQQPMPQNPPQQANVQQAGTFQQRGGVQPTARPTTQRPMNTDPFFDNSAF